MSSPSNRSPDRKWTIVVWALLVAGVVGCQAMESESDKKHKANLVGAWYSEAKDPDSEAKIDALIVLRSDGKFTTTRRLTEPGHPVQVDNEAGEWYVTDSLYKRRTDSLNGKVLGRAQQSYATCRIESVSPSDLRCVNDVSQYTFTQRRVPADFKLP